MPVIKPTTGRVVYHVAPECRKEDPFVAHICHVNADGTVNIVYYDHSGIYHRRLNVPMVQDGEQPPVTNTNYCFWMPYQLGQAAKTEAAEAKTNASPQS